MELNGILGNNVNGVSDDMVAEMSTLTVGSDACVHPNDLTESNQFHHDENGEQYPYNEDIVATNEMENSEHVENTNEQSECYQNNFERNDSRGSFNSGNSRFGRTFGKGIGDRNFSGNGNNEEEKGFNFKRTRNDLHSNDENQNNGYVESSTRGFGQNRGFESQRNFGENDNCGDFNSRNNDRSFGRKNFNQNSSGFERKNGNDYNSYGGGDEERFGNKRGFGGEERGFGGERRGYGGNRRGFGGEERGFGGERRGFGGEGRGFGGEKRGFGGEGRGFGGEGRGFGGEGRGFGGEGRGFGGEGRGFGGRRGRNTDAEGFDNAGMPRGPVKYIPPQTDEPVEAVSKGVNYHKYQQLPVECTGAHAPKQPSLSFEECGLDERLLGPVFEAGYTEPTPIQQWAIPAVLQGTDVMGCAITGSGKTASFLLPTLTLMLRNGDDLTEAYRMGRQEPMILVVGPTRELVVQIHAEAVKLTKGTNVLSALLYGGVSVGHQARKLSNGAHVIIATVGRLLDFVNKGMVSLSKVRYLVLDEADRMLDMGFKDDIFKIASLVAQEHQTLMFSATFPQDVRHIASMLLYEPVFISVGQPGGANMDIRQDVLKLEPHEKKQTLVDLLKQQPGTRSLVFVETKKMADFVALFLCNSNLPSTSIHGDREQREREEALWMFKTDKTPILVATSVASRGLDIPRVEHVINYDMPNQIDEYVHRIGRTGRLGNLGQATTFFSPSRDADLAKPLLETLVSSQQRVPDWLQEFVRTGGIFPGGMGTVGQRKLVGATYSAGDFDTPKNLFVYKDSGDSHPTDYENGGFGNDRGVENSYGNQYGNSGDSYSGNNNAANSEEEVWD